MKLRKIFIFTIFLGLFLSYAFWYERHFRSVGILGISLVGLFLLVRGKWTPLEMFWRDRLFLLCLLFFSIYHLFRSSFGWEAWNEFDRYSRVMFAIPFGIALVALPDVSLYRVLKYLIACSIISFSLAFLYYIFWLGNTYFIDLGMNAIQTSFTCSVYTMLAVPMVFYATDNRERVGWVALVLASLFGVIMTGRSSGLLFIILLSLILMCVVFRRNSKRDFVRVLVVFAAISFSLVYFTETTVETRGVRALTALLDFVKNWNVENYLSGKRDTVSPRLLLWEHGIQLIGSEFWFGIGKEALESSYANNEALVKYYRHVTPHLHNGFLQALVVKGYVGFLCFLSVIVIPLGYFWDSYKFTSSKEYKAVSLMGMGVIFVFVLNNLTQVIFGHMNGVMMYSFTIMLLWSVLYSLRNGDVAQQSSLNKAG